MPALKFWGQTQINFFCLLSVSIIVTHCSTVSFFNHLLKKKKRRRKKEKQPLTKYGPCLHITLLHKTGQNTRSFGEKREKIGSAQFEVFCKHYCIPEEPPMKDKEVWMATAKKQNTSHHHKDGTLPDVVDKMCADCEQANTWAAQETKNAQDSKKASGTGRAKRVRCLEKLDARNSLPQKRSFVLGRQQHFLVTFFLRLNFSSGCRTPWACGTFVAMFMKSSWILVAFRALVSTKAAPIWWA